jgi:hypothetical protein
MPDVGCRDWFHRWLLIGLSNTEYRMSGVVSWVAAHLVGVNRAEGIWLLVPAARIPDIRHPASDIRPRRYNGGWWMALSYHPASDI